MRLCYDLTPDELTDGKLADIARQLGHSSLAEALDRYNWWAVSVDDVEQALIHDLKMQTK